MELDSLRKEFDQQVRILGRSLATKWESELRRTNPVDTGLMRSRTKVRESRNPQGISVTATVDTEYAEMVSGGTRPHVITARGQALRFNWHGKTVYFKSVHHPGTKPNPWFTDSVKHLPRLAADIWNAL